MIWHVRRSLGAPCAGDERSAVALHAVSGVVVCMHLYREERWMVVVWARHFERARSPPCGGSLDPTGAPGVVAATQHG